MSEELQIVRHDMFGNLECYFYKNDKSLFMTKEQVGIALEYSQPQKSIDNIHQRNKDRLDPLSMLVPVMAYDNKPHPTRVYMLRGVMEICRLSRQPKADAFMDFVWNVMESIYTGNNQLVPADNAVIELTETVNRLVKEQGELKQLILTLANGNDAAAVISKEDSASPVVISVVNKDDDAQSSWRKSIYRKIDAVICNSADDSINRKYVLNLVYEKMKRDYGFVEEQERIDFRKRHPYHGGYVTRIEIIENSGTWSDIFECILEDVLNAMIIKIAKSPVVVKAVEIKDEVQIKDEKPNKKTAQVQTTPQIIADSVRDMDLIADKVAAKIGEKNFRHPITYRAIYAHMKVRWKMVETLFEKRFGYKAMSKKYLIGGSATALKEFKRAAQEIIDS